MIKTNWMDDEAATRLLRVLEEDSMDYGCAVEALHDLVETYFDAGLNDKGRTECSKRVDEHFDAICSQFRLICNQLLEFDRDLNAAIEGSDSSITYERQYLREIAPND